MPWNTVARGSFWPSRCLPPRIRLWLPTGRTALRRGRGYLGRDSSAAMAKGDDRCLSTPNAPRSTRKAPNYPDILAISIQKQLPGPGEDLSAAGPRPPARGAFRSVGGSRQDRLSAEVHCAFDTGPSRTMQQDFELGVLQIVDIALKAISPAVNDPSAAINCIDQLGPSLFAGHAASRLNRFFMTPRM
jgi:hypothetical protein